CVRSDVNKLSGYVLLLDWHFTVSSLPTPACPSGRCAPYRPSLESAATVAQLPGNFPVRLCPHRRNPLRSGLDGICSKGVSVGRRRANKTHGESKTQAVSSMERIFCPPPLRFLLRCCSS